MDIKKIVMHMLLHDRIRKKRITRQNLRSMSKGKRRLKLLNHVIGM
jgi:hypothetical protein